MEIGLSKTDLAEIFLLEHGPGPLNIEPRDSVCAFGGIHFLEANCFILGFEKRNWIIEKGCAFLTERGRLHKYSHIRGVPPDTVLSVRFSTPLLECMRPSIEYSFFCNVRLLPNFAHRWYTNNVTSGSHCPLGEIFDPALLIPIAYDPEPSIIAESNTIRECSRLRLRGPRRSRSPACSGGHP